MKETGLFSQVSVGAGLLPWPYMKPTERGRAIAAELLRIGISQKVLAAAAGVSESTFSRWFNEQLDSKGNPVDLKGKSLDALEAFLEQVGSVADALRAKETQRSATQAEIPVKATGTAGSLQRSGTYAGPERRSEDRGRPDGLVDRRRSS